MQGVRARARVRGGKETKTGFGTNGSWLSAEPSEFASAGYLTTPTKQFPRMLRLTVKLFADHAGGGEIGNTKIGRCMGDCEL